MEGYDAALLETAERPNSRKRRISSCDSCLPPSKRLDTDYIPNERLPSPLQRSLPVYDPDFGAKVIKRYEESVKLQRMCDEITYSVRCGKYGAEVASKHSPGATPECERQAYDERVAEDEAYMQRRMAGTEATSTVSLSPPISPRPDSARSAISPLPEVLPPGNVLDLTQATRLPPGKQSSASAPASPFQRNCDGARTRASSPKSRERVRGVGALTVGALMVLPSSDIDTEPFSSSTIMIPPFLRNNGAYGECDHKRGHNTARDVGKNDSGEAGTRGPVQDKESAMEGWWRRRSQWSTVYHGGEWGSSTEMGRFGREERLDMEKREQMANAEIDEFVREQNLERDRQNRVATWT